MKASVYRVGSDRILYRVEDRGTVRAARQEADRRNRAGEVGLFVGFPARMDGYSYDVFVKIGGKKHQ